MTPITVYYVDGCNTVTICYYYAINIWFYLRYCNIFRTNLKRDLCLAKYELQTCKQRI